MSLPVEVPGLSGIIPQVADGKVVIVESGADGVKSFFARQLARTALRMGQPVTYITSRDGPEVTHQLQNGGAAPANGSGPLRVLERDSLEGWEEIETLRGVLIVDSFSFLALELPISVLSMLLRRIRSVAQSQGLTVILATDRGMLDARSEAVLGHLSDGWVQFHVREGPEGLIRYLRVPKWTEGTLVDRNIYYEYDGRRLAIDLRRRVL